MPHTSRTARRVRQAPAQQLCASFDHYGTLNGSVKATLADALSVRLNCQGAPSAPPLMPPREHCVCAMTVCECVLLCRWAWLRARSCPWLIVCTTGCRSRRESQETRGGGNRVLLRLGLSDQTLKALASPSRTRGCRSRSSRPKPSPPCCVCPLITGSPRFRCEWREPTRYWPAHMLLARVGRSSGRTCKYMLPAWRT